MTQQTEAENESENMTTFHAREAFAVHTNWADHELTITDFYNHTKISGPKADEFVDRFCGENRGDFDAKLKKSPLVDDTEEYVYAIK